MTSNVYLGWGTVNDQRVMKVGKANVVSSREAQIAIKVYSSLACPTERDAFTLEDNLRWVARRLGAITLEGHKDWFVYDERIYAELEAYLTEGLFIAPQQWYRRHASLDDLEIEIIRERYAEIKKREHDAQSEVLSWQRHEQATILKIEALESAIMEGSGNMERLMFDLEIAQGMLVRIRQNYADAAATARALLHKEAS